MNIFFDVDGVLIDGFHTKPERRNRWDKNLERDLGIHPDKMQEIFSGWFLEVLQGRLDLREEMSRWLCANNYDVPAQTLIDYWHDNDVNINRALYDVVEKLADHPDVNLYIATHQSHERADYLWNRLGFKNHFKQIYHSAKVGFLKNTDDYYQKIEEDLEISPERDVILFFDDDERNTRVAAARGWNAVLFDTADDLVNHPAIQKLLSV